jgi:hypothetical protein
MHQLNLIIKVLGSPSEDFIGLAHSDRAKDFLRSQLTFFLAIICQLVYVCL